MYLNLLDGFKIKLARWVFIALGLQLLVIYAGLGQLGIFGRSVLVLSYLLLLFFIWANRRHFGLLIIGAGLFLNFLATVANGGLMPISPAAMERAGLEEHIDGVQLGEPVPRSENVLLEREDTRLWFLSDILVWENPTNFRVYSVGDTVIGAGLLLTLGTLLLPRPRRMVIKDKQASRVDDGLPLPSE